MIFLLEKQVIYVCLKQFMKKNDMNKFISVTVLILSLGCYDTSSKYKEPSYTLTKKLDNYFFS